MIRTICAVMVIAVTLLGAGDIFADNQEFVDYWVGTIRVMDSEMEIHLEIEEQDNQYRGLISIPEQFQYDLELSDFNVDYPDISFDLEAGPVATFQGSMKEGYISGNFSQSGINGLFHLVRGDKRSMRKEPVELESLEGEEEIEVQTSYGSLYGSLVLPSTGYRFPLVIIVAGSGPTDRDGNNPLLAGRGYVYRQIAEELKEAGIATLRYDKRGIGKSSGALQREEDLRFDYFVNDVVSWAELLKSDERFTKLVILGHSEGSLLGILAAGQIEVDGLITAAGAGRDMADVLLEQFSRQPDPYRSEAEEIIEALREGNMVSDVSEELYGAFRSSIQPFLISCMQYDPGKEIGKLDIPILIIQGTTDIQITVEDARKLANANEVAELVIIDGMNHMFRTSTTDIHDAMSSYGEPELPLTEGFIESIIDFIRNL